MKRVTFSKDCDCKQATASGPRIVIETKQEGYSIIVTSTWLPGIACDKCNKLWKEIK